jgi:hypothetical protein
LSEASINTNNAVNPKDNELSYCVKFKYLTSCQDHDAAASHSHQSREDNTNEGRHSADSVLVVCQAFHEKPHCLRQHAENQR